VQGKDAEVIFRAKMPMLRAFNAAKDHYKSKSDIGQDYVQVPEYRIFLLYLR